MGEENAVYHPELLAKAVYEEPILAPEDGYVQKIICDEAGIASLILGGGRETKDSVIDLSVGIILNKKVGAHVNAGEELAVLYANDKEKLKTAKERLMNAYRIGKEKIEKNKVRKNFFIIT